jgi:hypothetical protein
LQLHREDPARFEQLFNEYRNRVNPAIRAPHRLAVWLKEEDLVFQSCEDLKREQGRRLVKALDHPKQFGFTLRRAGRGAIGERDLANQEYYLQASPSAVGALTYIAFETRRLYQAMKPRGEKWVPLEVTALVHPMDYESRFTKVSSNGAVRDELPAHCTGQVFDIDFSNLPPGQREALQFVLSDIGWNGYLGFVQETKADETYHIGAAPSARDFFGRIFEEAIGKKD